MRTRWMAATAVGIASLVAVAGCQATPENPPSSSASSETVTLTLGAVPSLDLGLITLAEDQGYFAAEHVAVKIVPVDSGPNVVTGVVAGQYDIGSTAWAPPLLAFAQGADLKVVSGLGTVGADGTNGGVFVKKGSGITTWADLAGKKIASNAPRSLFSLTVPAAIAKDGGDASGIEIVPLPFNEIAQAVEKGQVDAGASLDPFLTAGLSQYPDLINLGDSIAQVLPEGSGSGVYFTSGADQSAKSDAIAGFKSAIEQAITYANAHPDELKKAGAQQAGLTEKQALAQPLTPYTGEVSADSLKTLLDLMVQFKWIDKAPDLSVFLG